MLSRKDKSVLVASCLCFLLWPNSSRAQDRAAQTAPSQTAAGRGPGPAPKSPEVAADDTVTFRLRAPNAKDVFVTGLGSGPDRLLAMQKDDHGVWAVTTAPLKPDIYTYSFSVDGAILNDPGNPLFKTSYAGGGQSMVRVPGNNPWDILPSVPHGVVARHSYESKVFGDNRDYYVYTPPGYDRKKGKPYPVLYLIHGNGDDAYAWMGIGAADLIVDNLIAQGKARPMIVVAPLGYGAEGVLRGPDFGGDQMMPNFAKSLVQEVVP